MLDEIKKLTSGKSNLKDFGITIGIILLFVAGLLLYKDKESFIIFFCIGIALIGFGLILPHFLRPLYLVWMTFAIILGWFMTRIILSLLFYVIISPIGIFSRLGSFFSKRFPL